MHKIVYSYTVDTEYSLPPRNKLNMFYCSRIQIYFQNTISKKVIGDLVKVKLKVKFAIDNFIYQRKWYIWEKSWFYFVSIVSQAENIRLSWTGGDTCDVIKSLSLKLKSQSSIGTFLNGASTTLTAKLNRISKLKETLTFS